MAIGRKYKNAKVKAFALQCTKDKECYELAKHFKEGEFHWNPDNNSLQSHQVQCNYLSPKMGSNLDASLELNVENLKLVMADWFRITQMDARSFYFFIRTIVYEVNFPLILSMDLYCKII